MISIDNMTLIRSWQFDADSLISTDEIKKYLDNIIASIEAQFFINDAVVEGKSLGSPEINCISFASKANERYMPVYVLTIMGDAGPVVIMCVSGRGEQINSTDLSQYYQENRAMWEGVYNGYREMKYTVNRINSRLGNSGTAANVVTGASYLAGKAISGGVKLAIKGVKALTRDKEAYDKELKYYMDVMNLGDYAFAEKDAEKYFVKIREGAEKGSIIAQYLLGTRYYDGIGVEKNKLEGIKWFEEAAEQGQHDSRELLAYEFLFGEYEYSKVQKNKGLVYLLELINAGNNEAVEAMIELCVNTSKYGVGLSPAKRIDFLNDYAGQGYISAAYNLAIIYDSEVHSDPDFETFKDDSKACALYESILSANNDFNTEEISYRLGCMYSNGISIPRDPEKACIYFEEANRRGNNNAKANLLQLYASDPRVKDFSKAKKLCKELLRTKNASLNAVGNYYSYVIADAEERYKDSMAYAKQYLSSAAGEEPKKEEVRSYLLEKNKLLASMTEEERRVYLKERKKAKDVIKDFKGVEIDSKKKKIYAVILTVVIIAIVIIVIAMQRPFDKTTTPYTNNESMETTNSPATEALKAYDSMLSQESFSRDENDDVYPQTWYSENCSFDIAYLNDDDVPELIIVDYSDADHATGWGQIYSYNDGEVSSIGRMSEPEASEDYGFTPGYYERTGWLVDLSMWQGYGGPVIYNVLDNSADALGINYEPDEDFEPQLTSYTIGTDNVDETEFYQHLEDVTGGIDITPYDFCENTSDNRLNKLGDFGEIGNDEEDTSTSGIYGVAFDYVGKTFGELDNEYGPLSQQASWNGAIYYTTSDERYVGFPFDLDETGDLADGDEAICTSYIGSISEILNVPEDASLQEVADLLGEDLDVDSLYYEPNTDMGNCVIWYTIYNDKEYKLIVDYDENIDISGATLVCTE